MVSAMARRTGVKVGSAAAIISVKNLFVYRKGAKNAECRKENRSLFCELCAFAPAQSLASGHCGEIF
jgi:hypothetical protein